MPGVRYAAAAAVVSTVAFVSLVCAGAMERAELKDVPPTIREWFKSMVSPSGKPCCSYADGHRTEFEIRGNEYWVPINEVWSPVPSQAVLVDKGNPFAEAVVWYSPIIENKKWSGRYEIICFVPGSGA
jgi:hypothetical protein